MYGQVVRVTYEIDAENRTARTSFMLSHLRTEKENESDATSIDRHPLFGDSVVAGSPLVPAYAFGDKK